MKIYLVGGAIRDQLLGHAITERDWVVVGATPQLMLDLGYRPVGKDFPVFLHPHTHEEYALARTERKTAPGYKGFIFHAAPDVTLIADLKRRDLTINAMAQDIAGNIIDPFHGQEDLKNKILRHVSAAFSEDPVRILRVARLAARFGDFTVHPDTQKLMRHMVENSEVDALVPERVWQEWQRALAENSPQRFFEVLDDCDALNVLFPMLKNNSAGLTALNHSIKITTNTAIRLAVVLHSLDPDAICDLAKRYRIPKDHHDLAILIAKHHVDYPNIANYIATDLLNLLKSLDAFRQKIRFQHFLLACDIIYPHIDNAATLLEKALLSAQSVNAQIFIEQGLTGTAIGEAMYAAQLAAIARHTPGR